MNPPSTSSSFDAANLANLPIDLLQPILSSPTISRQDVKAIRLACRPLAHKAASVLFYRIRISSLTADRDAFFNIAGSAHLSHHVRILVWEELNGDHERFHRRPWLSHSFPPWDEWPLMDDILAQMRSLFWLKSESPEYDKQAALSAFLPRFQSAVDSMPNLHTLVSKPMHPERQLQGISSNYPLIPRIIKRLIHHDEDNCIFNEGFTTILIPTLRHLATQPSARVTRLLFADEGVRTATSLTRLTHADVAAFSKLEHLDLCISGSQPGVEDLNGLIACLRHAANLSHLHICQESAYRIDEDVPLSLLRLIPTLPSLTEVHLDDVRLKDMLPEPAFVDFMWRHASTLRKVYVTTSTVTKGMLFRLASMSSLQLDRFVIIPNEDMEEEDPWPTSEQAILSFLNQRLGPDEPTPQPSGHPSDPVRTHLGVFDVQGWTTAAILDTRQKGWSQRGYEDWEVMALDEEAGEWRDEDGLAHELGPFRVYNPSIGLWVDREGIWYSPRTDEEMIEPERRHYESEDNSWIVKGQRTWDWELGLWSDSGAGTRGKFHKFAVDRHGIDKTAVGLDHDMTSEDDHDMQPFYTEEDDNYILRKTAGPRWDWGRDDENNIWYWEVLGNNGFGYPTEMWRFVHRDGEQAYGNDPLEFWSDWEGSEAGDVAEATPYGWHFLSFVEEWPRAGPGSGRPAKEEIGHLYREPVLYQEADDPMEDEDLKSRHPVPAEFGADDFPYVEYGGDYSESEDALPEDTD
ncbi:hypothetical protein B0T10DRAFT_493175 [Thelonectria olida]|uniref:F-box domain-containing protein n=1 Tax=Thelonectria olida TaxID=1576542 RepID=A0A9P8W183_9HYPO|nr:hypothetical protein B0T10DRAFT_493175 [Thelonectria olida]